jgi:hypothetical protein
MTTDLKLSRINGMNTPTLNGIICAIV